MEEGSVSDIAYPFLPDDRNFTYIPAEDPFDFDNQYMAEAAKVAFDNPADESQTVGAVVVQDAEIISRGQNGSDYHERMRETGQWENGCRRRELEIPSGEGYDLCEGCHPKNHSEPTAILDALGLDRSELNITEGESVVDTIAETVDEPYATDGADLYMWGHWWACEPCWETMDHAGIDTVYLLDGSERWFNKNHADYIFDNGVAGIEEHFDTALDN